jgi:hypothetical protein
MGNTGSNATLGRNIMLHFFFHYVKNGHEMVTSAMVVYNEDGEGDRPHPMEVKNLMDKFQMFANNTELKRVQIQATDVDTKVVASVLCFNEERLNSRVDQAITRYPGSTRVARTRHPVLLEIEFEISDVCKEDVARNLARLFTHFGLSISGTIPVSLNLTLWDKIRRYDGRLPSQSSSSVDGMYDGMHDGMYDGMHDGVTDGAVHNHYKNNNVYDGYSDS